MSKDSPGNGFKPGREQDALLVDASHAGLAQDSTKHRYFSGIFRITEQRDNTEILTSCNITETNDDSASEDLADQKQHSALQEPQPQHNSRAIDASSNTLNASLEDYAQDERPNIHQTIQYMLSGTSRSPTTPANPTHHSRERHPRDSASTNQAPSNRISHQTNDQPSEAPPALMLFDKHLHTAQGKHSGSSKGHKKQAVNDSRLLNNSRDIFNTSRVRHHPDLSSGNALEYQNPHHPIGEDFKTAREINK